MSEQEQSNVSSEKPELWRKTSLVRDVFEVSNFGRICKRISSDSYILLSGSSSGAYHRVKLDKKDWSVHRLVLDAFVGPCLEGHEVNHIDGNKRNNRLDNLEYCTRSENQLHAYRLGLSRPTVGEINGCSKLSEAQVVELCELYSTGMSQMDVARRFRITQSNVKCIVQGETWKHVPRKTEAAHSRRSFYATGERNIKAKISAQEVVAIRSLQKAGASIAFLANKFSLSKNGIRNIINHRSWRTV